MFHLYFSLSFVRFVVYRQMFQSFENFCQQYCDATSAHTNASVIRYHTIFFLCCFSARRFNAAWCTQIDGPFWLVEVQNDLELWLEAENQFGGCRGIKSIRTHTNSPKQGPAECAAWLSHLISLTLMKYIESTAKRHTAQNQHFKCSWLCFTSTSRIIHLIVFDLKKLRL